MTTNFNKYIHSGYAFEDDEIENKKINNIIYCELINKYKIGWAQSVAHEDFDKYDIILSLIGPGYANMSYKILKRPLDITNNELALICDKGNLCFGYRIEGGGTKIVIYTD